jgi:activator of HSP90 ATPase
MTPVIQQRVQFNISPARLFRLYLDAAQHTAATHAKALITKKVGGRFSAFDGIITGKILALIPNRMIVQSWRARHWKKSDPDSILVLTFSKTEQGGRVDLVHTNVPAHDHGGVSRGWEKYYWTPWRAYLEHRAGRAGAR